MVNGAANYTEEQVTALVTTQPTIMSFPALNVQIVPFSSKFESIFGADAKIPASAKIAPFYMQVKRPSPLSTDWQDLRGPWHVISERYGISQFAFLFDP